jgi:hypothetical protein
MGGKCKDPDYNRNYYLRNRDRLIAKERERYRRLRLTPEFRKARKTARELQHFGISRDAIFRVSHGKCVDCGKKATVVHHLDGDGRTHERLGLPPGTNSDRLIGLCRACHMERHREELLAARKAARARRWAYQHDACLGCGTTAIKHCGRGYCRRCHPKVRSQERKSQACSL